MKKKITLTLASGVLISVATLYLAFKNVPLTELINYLKSINYLWIVPTTLIVLICFVLRAVRWQFILGSNRRINFWQAFHPLMIGFMINCILPGRVGEVARPVILKRNEDIPFSTGLATVAAERVFDMSMLIILFITFFTAVNIDPDLGLTFGKYELNRETLEFVFGGMLKLSVLFLAGILMVSLEKTRKIIQRLVMALPKLFFFASPSLKDKMQKRIVMPIVTMVDNAAAGFTLIKQPKRISFCIVFTVIIWALQAFSYYVFALGCPGVGLTFTEFTAVMIIICFFIALPSAPGFWGLWEAGGIFAMLLFGVSIKDAAGFTLANHAIQVFPVIFVGLVSAVITGVNIWQVSFGKESKEQV
jgi:uncharacterized protein (TIRG00374 family)